MRAVKVWKPGCEVDGTRSHEFDNDLNDEYLVSTLMHY